MSMPDERLGLMLEALRHPGVDAYLLCSFKLWLTYSTFVYCLSFLKFFMTSNSL